MKDLDVVGEFWQADKPERRVSGRLTFDKARGIELNLIGSLHDPREVVSRQTGPVISVPLEEMFDLNSGPKRILGETTRGPVTVDHCLRSSANFAFLGRSRPAVESYVGSLVLLGTHFYADEPLEFNRSGRKHSQPRVLDRNVFRQL